MKRKEKKKKCKRIISLPGPRMGNDERAATAGSPIEAPPRPCALAIVHTTPCPSRGLLVGELLAPSLPPSLPLSSSLASLAATASSSSSSLLLLSLVAFVCVCVFFFFGLHCLFFLVGKLKVVCSGFATTIVTVITAGFLLLLSCCFIFYRLRALIWFFFWPPLGLYLIFLLMEE